MKRFYLLTALALSLPGCAGELTGVASATGQATASADYLYISSSKAGEALVTAGVLDKTKFKAEDNAAYAILLKVRAGTATIASLNTAVATMLDTTK